VRVAALGSPVRRTVAPSYSSRTAGPLKRRLVVGLLVLASLAMITVYFRESPNGALHDFQSAASSAMRPFEIAAQRVSRPFRDAYGWTADLFHAKSENERLREELERVRQEATLGAEAVRQVEELSRLLNYQRGPTFPRDFPRDKQVVASVLQNPAGEFEQKIVITAGSNAGVGLHDAVITADGLVGHVSKVMRDTALVTLLTDEESAVTAKVQRPAEPARRRQAAPVGILRHGEGSGLVLDSVHKDKIIERGDRVITAGRQHSRLASLFPRGIQIGVVTSVSQGDIEPFKNVQVTPNVDFDSLDTVLVLVSEKPRPRMP
jgi:rod shape-determining protein MreC